MAEVGGAVTIRQVAEAAGVSKSSVSRYLRDSPHLSDEARAAIQTAIEKLDYRPNAIARNLSVRRTYAVGVLINELWQPWFADFLDGLGTTLHDHGLQMFIADRHGDQDNEERLLRSFVEHQMDGLVFAGTMNPSTAMTAASRRIPTVVAGNAPIPSARTDIVREDSKTGITLAMQHLLGLGHRRIAHVAGLSGEVFATRRATYEEIQTAEGGWAPAVEFGENSERDGYLAGQRLLARAERPTAILAATDAIALGVLAAASDLGLRVPADLSLIGYDNSYLARLRYVRLTSIDSEPVLQGQLAASTLAKRLDDPDREPVNAMITPSLVVRASTAPPAN